MFSGGFSPSWQKNHITAAPREVEGVTEAIHIMADQEAKKKTESGARFYLQKLTPSNPLPPAGPHLQKVYTQSDEVGFKS